MGRLASAGGFIDFASFRFYGLAHTREPGQDRGYRPCSRVDNNSAALKILMPP